MKKGVLLVFLLLFGLVLFPKTFVFAVDEHANIPEKTGDYPDPEHPGMRVHVFVHPQKPPEVPIQTCTDQDSDAPVALAGWKLPASISYNLNLVSVPSSVGQSRFAQLTELSFATWTSGIKNQVSFTPGPTTTKNRTANDGINLLAWGTTSSRALAVTYIRYYSSSGQVVDVDTIFNKKVAWSWTPYQAGICGSLNSYDTQNILTHELGHWVGLGDEYTASYMDNTMYGYGSKGEIKKDTLEAGDIVNLSGFY